MELAGMKLAQTEHRHPEVRGAAAPRRMNGPDIARHLSRLGGFAASHLRMTD
jgi:hypothetical protein